MSHREATSKRTAWDHLQADPFDPDHIDQLHDFVANGERHAFLNNRGRALCDPSVPGQPRPKPPGRLPECPTCRGV